GGGELYVVLGIASAKILLFCAFIVRQPPVHVAPMPFSVREAIRTPAFKLLYFSAVLSSMGLFTPFVFLPAFARDHGATEVAAATLVGIIGGASVVGRMGLGTLADRLGVVRLFMGCYLVVALSFVLWLFPRAYPLLVGFPLAP